MGPCRVFTYYKNIYCSINPSEDVENLGRNTLVFESDWDKLPHLRKVAKSPFDGPNFGALGVTRSVGPPGPDGHTRRGSVWRYSSVHRCASPRSFSPDRAAPPTAVSPWEAPSAARPNVRGPGPPATPPACAPG